MMEGHEGESHFSRPGMIPLSGMMRRCAALPSSALLSLSGRPGAYNPYIPDLVAAWARWCLLIFSVETKI